MVKEEEIITEAAGARGYMEMLGLGEEAADYLMCLSPSSYLSSPAASTTTAVASPTCASYLAPHPYHHLLSFSGQDQYHGDDVFGLQYYGGDQVIPAVVPQKSSPTTECSSSVSSMSSSPTATAISSSKSPAFKVRTCQLSVSYSWLRLYRSWPVQIRWFLGTPIYLLLFLVLPNASWCFFGCKFVMVFLIILVFLHGSLTVRWSILFRRRDREVVIRGRLLLLLLPQPQTRDPGWVMLLLFNLITK